MNCWEAHAIWSFKELCEFLHTKDWISLLWTVVLPKIAWRWFGGDSLRTFYNSRGITGTGLLMASKSPCAYFSLYNATSDALLIELALSHDEIHWECLHVASNCGLDICCAHNINYSQTVRWSGTLIQPEMRLLGTAKEERGTSSTVEAKQMLNIMMTRNLTLQTTTEFLLISQSEIFRWGWILDTDNVTWTLQKQQFSRISELDWKKARLKDP